MNPQKKYGLLIPKKKEKTNTVGTLRPSIFDDNSDDETSGISSSKKDATKFKLKKQNQLEIEKALSQDSSVYEYDSIYEEISSESREKKKVTEKPDKQPRYINQLLKASTAKKRANERRVERGVQREREMEKGLYEDKESFVTDAYRQKMANLRADEEREERESKMEEMLDVRKQHDLSGFYRHLYKHTDSDPVDESKVKTEKTTDIVSVKREEMTSEELPPPVKQEHNEITCQTHTTRDKQSPDTTHKRLSDESSRKRSHKERNSGHSEDSEDSDEAREDISGHDGEDKAESVPTDSVRAKTLTKQNIGEKADLARCRYLARKKLRTVALMKDADD